MLGVHVVSARKSRASPIIAVHWEPQRTIPAFPSPVADKWDPSVLLCLAILSPSAMRPVLGPCSQLSLEPGTLAYHSIKDWMYIALCYRHTRLGFPPFAAGLKAHGNTIRPASVHLS